MHFSQHLSNAKRIFINCDEGPELYHMLPEGKAGIVEDITSVEKTVSGASVLF